MRTVASRRGMQTGFNHALGSFELASDLLLSGFGLVVAGLMILLVAFVAVRISRQFAPQTVRGDGESTA